MIKLYKTTYNSLGSYTKKDCWEQYNYQCDKVFFTNRSFDISSAIYKIKKGYQSFDTNQAKSQTELLKNGMTIDDLKQKYPEEFI